MQSRSCVFLVFVSIFVFVLGSSLALAFDWDRFNGEEVRIMGAQKQWTEVVSARIGEFEKLTGIKVNLEIFPENQFRQKLSIELASGASTVDVFMVDPIVGGLLYWKSGWLESLNEYMEDLTLTNPAFDYNDFLEAAKKSAILDNEIIGVNSEVDGQILYYNKELFNQCGLKPPETLKEMEDAAKSIKNLDSDIYGIVLRGMGPKAVSQWSTFMVNLGGWWTDKEGNADLTAPEVIEAFKLYGRLLREYGPPGAANLDWPDALSLFAQGKVGMYADAASFRKTLVDPSSSRIADKWGAVAMPSGPSGTHPMMNTWLLAINSNSKNKGPAWFLIQWLTSKEMALEALLTGIPSPRNSAWVDPKFSSSDPYPDWTKAFRVVLEKGNPQFQAPVINVEKAKDIIGPVITVSIMGGNVEEAAAKANRELQSLIEEEREKYGK